MVAYDYNAAKAALSDADKDRILAVYLNMTLTDNTAVDWKKAAADYGSASVDSFKKMLANALKKVKEAETNGGTPAAAVGATLKSGGGKKRKAAAAGADDDEENATPVKKGRGRPRKNVTPKAEEAVEGDGDNEASPDADFDVKEEPDVQGGLTFD